MQFNDFEELYMVRQGTSEATYGLFKRFDRLLWKKSYDFYHEYASTCVGLDELYQEGLIGIHDAIQGFGEHREVGFAWYVKICVDSRMRSLMRKYRSKKNKTLIKSTSFEKQIGEDGSMTVSDIVPCTYVRFSPVNNAYLAEADLRSTRFLKMTFEPFEVNMFVRWYQGYSYLEIAEQVGLTAKQVDNTLQKMRRSLKNLYEMKV